MTHRHIVVQRGEEDERVPLVGRPADPVPRRLRLQPRVCRVRGGDVYSVRAGAEAGWWGRGAAGAAAGFGGFRFLTCSAPPDIRSTMSPRMTVNLEGFSGTSVQFSPDCPTATCPGSKRAAKRFRRSAAETESATRQEPRDDTQL